MRKVKVMFARFPGNMQEHPESSNWVMNTALHAKLKDTERVSEIVLWDKSDTPIDMVRNECVHAAKMHQVDILFMIDNDMKPDAEGGNFYETAMDFLVGRIPPSVIAAPYVGGGLHNNVFVFEWKNANNHEDGGNALEAYTREQAADLEGVQPAAALPTGLIAYDMRVFDRLDPKDPGYFYYEMNPERTKKESTEDVTNTRDISLAWSDVEGAGCFCAWDDWAHHLKIVPCTKPRKSSVQSVGAQLRYSYDRANGKESLEVCEIGENGYEPAFEVDHATERVAFVRNDNGRLEAQARKAFPEHARNKPEEI